VDFSGLLKFKSVDKQFVLAVSAYQGSCIVAIFKDKKIIDRFSIPTHMRFILKQYLKKLRDSIDTELRLPIMKVNYNRKENKFSSDIQIILNKDKKYQYNPYYIEVVHTDLLHMNFPITLPAGVSINEEKLLPIPAKIALSYVIDFFENNLEIALFLSKVDSEKNNRPNNSNNQSSNQMFTSV
jgi:hypothetical protein